MTTRLQMTPVRARVSRERAVSNVEEFAAYCGAKELTIAGAQAALRLSHDGGICVRPAILPRIERWAIRLRRRPGGWDVGASRARPDSSPLLHGTDIPRYVRLTVPIDKNGQIPRSLAPRVADLQHLIHGKWLPYDPEEPEEAIVSVTVDAPMHGVIVSLPTGPAAPVAIRFPARTRVIARQLKALVETRAERARQRISAHNERRRNAAARTTTPGADQ